LNRFCDFFQMNDDRIDNHLIRWYKTNDFDQGFSYEVIFDMMKHVVQAGISRPLQLKLGHISSLSAITDSVGQGWNSVKILRYFEDITNDEEKQKFEEKQKMKTSCQFKEAFILLSTVKQMKYTLTKSNKRLFTIECYMCGYDSKNTWVHKHHKHLFKDDNYTFQPNDDLVKSMPYDFVKTLKACIFSSLDKTRMKKLHIILKMVQSHSIKRLRLVRLLKVNDFGKRLNN
jgi:hypothetical protein